MKLYQIIRLFISILLLQLLKECEGNTPPVLKIKGDLELYEDEPIGSVVTRFTVHDDQPIENLRFDISASNFGQDGSKFLQIDPNGKILLTQSLTGLGGQVYFVKIVVDDGHIPVSRDVRIKIKPEGSTAFSRPFRPPGSGLPPFVQNSYSPLNFSPSISPPIFTPPSNNYNKGLKPTLMMSPNTVWTIPTEVSVGSQVKVVEVISGEGVSFNIEPSDIVNINNKTGAVVLIAPLSNKIGDHKLQVSASNQYGTSTENVTLVVKSRQSTYKRPNVQIQQEQIPKIQINPKKSTTYTTAVNNGIVIKPSIRPPHNGNHLGEIPVNNSIRSEPGSSKGDALSVTMITVVAVLLALPLIAGVVYIYWRFHISRKAKRLSKESAVSYYSQNGESTIVADLSLDHKTDKYGFSDKMWKFWHNRANSNKYSESTPPKVPSRETIKDWPKIKPDHWEIPRHTLHIISILGEGCFGQVWKAEYKSSNKSEFVAVKTLRDNAGVQERKDLFQELKVLKSLGKHPNVVSLLGCCTEKDPIFVVLEYMIEGKLQSYLRSSRADHGYNNLHGASTNLSPKDLTVFALQVANGMDFLAKNGIIHRDLAARNVLVGENKICKVADFGFARDVANNHVYERKSDGRLPIRWMAPESLFDNIFTVKSDVWSFGILLWEIVTLGSTPYPGLSAQEVMHQVKSGYRLDKPEHCRRELYNIMYYCWSKDAENRPSYAELIESLENMLLSEVDYIQLDRFPDHGYYNMNSHSGELL